MGTFFTILIIFFFLRFVFSIFKSSSSDNNVSAADYKQLQDREVIRILMTLFTQVIRADGKVMHSEMNYARDFVAHVYGSHLVAYADATIKGNLEQIKRYGEQYWMSHLSNTCANIRNALTRDAKMVIAIALCDIAKADGVVTQEEVDAIHGICRMIGVDPAFTNQYLVVNNPETKLDDAYKILGVDPNASDDEVKKAYKKAVLQFHPDKVAHLGEEMKAYATQKVQELNTARDLIYKSRGIK